MKRIAIAFGALVVLATVGSLGLTDGDLDAQDPSSHTIAEQYIVIVRSDFDPGQAAIDARASHGAQVLHVYRHAINGFSFRGSAAAAEALTRNPRIISVTPDHRLSAFAPKKCDKNPNAPGCGEEAPSQSLPDGVNRIDADLTATAASNGAAPADVDVAVLDTGIDTEHTDLNVVGGANFVGGTSFSDDHGHGTHVAGTIGAIDNGQGVVGVAPGARLHAVKVLNSMGEGSDASVIAGIDWAADPANSIEMINMSLGGFGSDVDSPLRQAVNNAVAAGVVIVVAAGNEGWDAALSVPAAYDAVITVSAIDPSNDTFASFSNWGPDVDLAAPGVDIDSTTMGGGTSGPTWDGTSMAAPHVAGAAALYLANNPGAMPHEVKTYLVLTGEPAPDGGWLGDPDEYDERLVDAEWTDPMASMPNFTPWVQIDDPTGEVNEFRATAMDYEEGAMPGSMIHWSVDGFYQDSGETFAPTLTDGTHTVTAAATDSGSATGSASRTVVVGLPTLDALTVDVVTDQTSYRNREKVIITVHVSLAGSPVAGADAHVDVITANGTSLVGDRLTSSFGSAAFSYRVDARKHGYGSYTVDASAAMAGFDPGSNSTTFEVR